MSEASSDERTDTPAVSEAARALWGQSNAREIAREFSRAGIPVMLLKGPDLQVRLYGRPTAYPSSDLDVLVPRGRAAVARRTMARNGWAFERDNGVLWRVSGAAAYVRDGFRVDLHWGLHAAHLPSWSLRPLERRLWEGASPGPGGLLQPDAESLLVFLAVHAAGHGFERAAWTENVHRAAALVTDWQEVRRIARASRVQRAVLAALHDGGRGSGAVLDGPFGEVVSFATWVGRGHFLPQRARNAIRDAVASARDQVGRLARRAHTRRG
jgi:Uncharacterised nucleotidyltransferase